jgi:hypothetical protein
MAWRIVLLGLLSIGWGLFLVRYGWRAWRTGQVHAVPEYGAPFVVTRQASPIRFWLEVVLSALWAPVSLAYGIFILGTGRLY